jgi:hypothetical protein
MPNAPFVPETFAVPTAVETDGFRLELLGPQHNEADHIAWMSSIPEIRSTPGFGAGWPPAAGMTLAENLADLRSHEDRSARHVDFAYTVMDAGSGVIIGCVYINPPAGDDQADAVVRSWVTGGSADRDEALTRAVGSWLSEAWPFRTVRYRVGLEPALIRHG